MTPVYLLTIKNSKREFTIKKKLKLLKINFKTFYAIDGKNPKNFNILDKYYDSKKSLHHLGREMTYFEKSCAEGHQRIYKYILQKKIKNAVIIEDDCNPSKLLVKWLKLKKYFDLNEYNIIQIFLYAGMVYKNPYKKILNFYIHKACFVIPTTTCYQISYKACHYILANNKKIFRLVDWPINFHEGKIKQFAVLPGIISLVPNHQKTSHQTNLWKRHNLMKLLKKIIPFYGVLTALYFLSHIPFIFSSGKNYSYYKEKFLMKKIIYLKSLFSANNYINITKK